MAPSAAGDQDEYDYDDYDDYDDYGEGGEGGGAGADERSRKDRRRARMAAFFGRMETRKENRRERRMQRARARAHNAMVRTTVRLAAMAAACALILCAGAFTAVRAHQDRLDDTPLYTSTFTTSASRQAGRVIAMAENKARTRAFMLLSVGGTDPSKGDRSTATALPPRADDYELHLMQLKANGSSVVPWEGERPSVRLIKYGTTGYFGIETTSRRPFDSKKSAVGIKSKVASSASQRSKAQSAQADTPYAELLSHTYDTAVVVQNLGGAAAPTPSWMERFDPDQAIYHITTDRAIATARKKLTAQTETMRDDLASIDTNHKALLQAGAAGLTVASAPLPADVVDDRIEGGTLSTAHPVPGAWTFDWKRFDGRAGWPADVVPEGADANAVIAAHRQSAGASASGGDNVADSDAWRLSDGRTLTQLGTQDANAAMSPTAPLSDAAKGLTLAIDAYRSDKTAYQTTMMQAMVDAESNFLSMTRSKTSSTALQIYQGGRPRITEDKH